MRDRHLGRFSTVKQRVDLELATARAIHSVPYHDGLKARDSERSEVENMLAMNVMEPAPTERPHQLDFAPKKEGTPRLCVDYRRRNAVTIRNLCPFRRMNEFIDSLGDVYVFLTLDRKSGYWQIQMNPSDRVETAFSSHHGEHEINRKLFMWKNSPPPFGVSWTLICSKSTVNLPLCI